MILKLRGYKKCIVYLSAYGVLFLGMVISSYSFSQGNIIEIPSELLLNKDSREQLQEQRLQEQQFQRQLQQQKFDKQKEIDDAKSDAYSTCWNSKEATENKEKFISLLIDLDDPEKVSSEVSKSTYIDIKNLCLYYRPNQQRAEIEKIKKQYGM